MGRSPMALPRKKGTGCWHPGGLGGGAGWTCWVVAVGKSCQKREGMELGLEEEEIGKRLFLACFHFTFYWKLLLSFPCFEGGGGGGGEPIWEFSYHFLLKALCSAMAHGPGTAARSTLEIEKSSCSDAKRPFSMAVLDKLPQSWLGPSFEMIRHAYSRPRASSGRPDAKLSPCLKPET